MKHSCNVITIPALTVALAAGCSGHESKTDDSVRAVQVRQLAGKIAASHATGSETLLSSIDASGHNLSLDIAGPHEVQLKVHETLSRRNDTSSASDISIDGLDHGDLFESYRFHVGPKSKSEWSVEVEAVNKSGILVTELYVDGNRAATTDIDGEQVKVQSKDPDAVFASAVHQAEQFIAPVTNPQNGTNGI